MGKDAFKLLRIQKWKCGWFAVTIIASIVALFSVVHLLLFPLTSPFNYLKLARNWCINNASDEFGSKHVSQILKPTIDLKSIQIPGDDLHGAFVYRGTPWKDGIGQWLAASDFMTKKINITEIISGNGCKNDCNGQGVCNQELGKCRCFHGYDGDGCTERLQFECNYPGGSPDPSFRPHFISSCPANCDKTRAMCFCGEGTKYPNRPLTWTCGFQFLPPSETGGSKRIDWSRIDEDVFTTNGSKRGWCNVDPTDAYTHKVRFKEECSCRFDGLWGQFCEIPVQSACINQCSGHGHCHGGFCQCVNGWYGVDCRTPSIISSIGEWPSWLRPAQIDVPDNLHFAGKITNTNAVVEKERPLIYVYDLPPEFNSLLLEGRHSKSWCVNRLYDDNNATTWTEQLYGAQMALYESILASPHRTLNGEEADFFFVPVLDSCIIPRAGDAPHLSLLEHRGLRSSFTLDYYKKAYNHIVEQYPYWNRSSGRDHIWFFSWDEGACYSPKEIWNSMMLVHWGNTNTKHNYSTTAYWADNWNDISSDRRGNHPCFDPHKDLVLPAWKAPNVNALTSKLWARPYEKRKTLFYFNGNLGPAYPNGRPEDRYSMGIRQKLGEEFGSSPNKEGKLGKQHAEDVIVTPVRSENYHVGLANSVFCGVLPGDGWSGRMEDSILQGCIPVVIQDGIFMPYENVLNYDSFAIRIPEEEIPNLIKILRGWNVTEIKFKMANVQKIWQRFLYRDSVMLEAYRQKATYGHVNDWAVEFSRLIEDDVFATLIQVLHYKLHNDPWRKQVDFNKKYG
ncbi:putative glucuronoxylan glucuronosyltransferase F8H [Senna tora]|uniref:Putative glucuronoxylan glucuronosyltransferase F8H n=1 Tax=Senna tora TaxID=362788 RepID=A0A834WJ34_9FABA|nr:putative glucuronoxylan glucuronosyltransferase F8H [Senna tora]